MADIKYFGRLAKSPYVRIESFKSKSTAYAHAHALRKTGGYSRTKVARLVNDPSGRFSISRGMVWGLYVPLDERNMKRGNRPRMLPSGRYEGY